MVKAAFRQFGSLKAAGPDEIKLIVLKNLPDITLDIIPTNYKASLELGYMPRSWLELKVIFILKPGKESYKVAISFRPILLSSFLLKELEGVVGWHMEQTVLTKNPLSQWQHDFRGTKATENAIAEVVNSNNCILPGLICLTELWRPGTAQDLPTHWPGTRV